MSAEVSELVGKVIVGIDNTSQYDDELRFTLADGPVFVMSHHQDCCESVVIEEIVGDLNDLIDTPILVAEERSSDDRDEYTEEDRYYDDAVEWTFYEFRTIKGSVTIHWCGESNGYYSTSVDCWYA